jgi:uncharacterized protein (TIGR03435 family)
MMVVADPIGFRIVTARSLFEVRTLANGVQRVDATRITMPQFATLLRQNLGRPVFDRTGLGGVYQFKTDLDVVASPMVIPGSDARSAAGDPTGISTFKSVESLGLKLQALRGPLQILVVDKVNRKPTDN